jgi:hypothetical protein
LTEQNIDAWRAMLDADPSMTAEQLVAPGAPAPKAPTYIDHEQTVVAASEARYLMAEKVRTGEVCGLCRGTRLWLEDGTDEAVRCPRCLPNLQGSN